MNRDRLRGGLLGLLVGDALGVPYEFHGPEQIPPASDIEMNPPVGFPRAHRATPPGTWSDDGAQALCLLASLLDCGRLDTADLASRFVRWYSEGYLAVDGRVFDIGIQTAAALKRIAAGTPAESCGATGELDNGNGSLMRVLPLALWHLGSDAELVRDARAQSRITHGHERSQVACALYCLWARRVLQGAVTPFDGAVTSLRDLGGGSELDRLLAPWDAKGTGYVLDSLWSARGALEADSYENIARMAIAFGNDTDTTAAIAGGIAGLRHGEQGIPERWRVELRGRELLDPLLDRLCAHRGL